MFHKHENIYCLQVICERINTVLRTNSNIYVEKFILLNIDIVFNYFLQLYLY